MDPIERLLTRITNGLLGIGAIERTESGDIFIRFTVSTLIGFIIEKLWDLLCYAGRRIFDAIRERNPEESVARIVFQEIVAMGSESVDIVIEAVMAVIAFLRKLFNRASKFTQRLGQRALDLTPSSSSVRL